MKRFLNQGLHFSNGEANLLIMIKTRLPDDQGVHAFAFDEYGRSVFGAPLLYLPCESRCQMLVMAGVHGEEADATFLLSRALRMRAYRPKHCAVILCANPDGVALGTRGNANGVDLNRNWPCATWCPDAVLSRPTVEAPRITRLSPGAHPASEPEVQTLIQLLQRLKPQEIISIHSPLGCVDAPSRTPRVEWLCERFALPWQPDIGYPTPGSMGTWCAEQHIQCITLELPNMAPEQMVLRYAMHLAELME